MIQKRTLVGILLATTLLGIVPVFSIAMPSTSRNAQEGTELLKNPGFEGITCRAGSEPGPARVSLISVDSYSKYLV